MIQSEYISKGEFKFSVLMPVYYKDTPEYLYPALQSLKEQTLLPAEILIVKDGALSRSLDELIYQFENDCHGICRVISLKENRGLAHTLNEGLRHCSYEWIARMDSDDICHPERFERQVKYLKHHPEVDVVGANIEEFSFSIHDLKILRNVPSHHDDILKLSKYRCPVNHMTLLYKKSLVLDVGGYATMFGTFEDYPLWIKMLQSGAVFHNLPQVLMYVRVADMEMVRRRKGLRYARKEWMLAHYFLRIKHINIWQYGIWLFFRVPARLVPARVLRVIYYKVLRKSL